MSLPMFSKLEQQIKTLTDQQKSIQVLAENLNADCFDKEDRAIIQSKLRLIIDTKRQVEESLQKKKEIYQNQIVGMEKQLTQRQKVLESSDQAQTVFVNFPDVLEFFAHKQSELSGSLATIKEQIQQ